MVETDEDHDEPCEVKVTANQTTSALGRNFSLPLCFSKGMIDE